MTGHQQRLAWILIPVGVIAIWAIVGCVLPIVGVPEGAPGRGQFGDMFGAANALFSGLAFAGVIYAVILQTQELTEQRKGGEEQRKSTEASLLEMRRANEAQEKANDPVAISNIQRTISNDLTKLQMTVTVESITINLLLSQRERAGSDIAQVKRIDEEIAARLKSLGNLIARITVTAAGGSEAVEA